jgi:hypothetical protein
MRYDNHESTLTKKPRYLNQKLSIKLYRILTTMRQGVLPILILGLDRQ